MEFQIHSKTHGTFTVLVDDEDADLVRQHTWHVSKDRNGTFYVKTNIRRADGRYRRGYLSRMIMGEDGPIVDHADGNTLDNRRSNLRHATNQQNCANRGPQANNKSSFKGVSFFPNLGKWAAKIRVDQSLKHLGYFEQPQEAAKAYDAAAREYFGEFAFQNFA